MKKRILLLVCVCLVAATVTAQSASWRNVNIYDNLRLKGMTVNAISTDTSFATADDVSVPTAKAVRDFVLNRAGRSPIANSTTPGLVYPGPGLYVDSITGQIVPITYTFPVGAVPYAGSTGLLKYDATGFWFDGTNLNVGKSDFYANSGLSLNGGRGWIAASGSGMIMGNYGVFDPDFGKYITFVNNSGTYGRFGAASVTDLYFESRSKIYPLTNNAYDLGLSAKRWRTIYGRTARFDSMYINSTLFDPAGLQAALSGTGFIKISGSTISYDPATYLTSVPAQSWVSITTKPTTIGGYGITDLNSLGDARWSALAHSHAFSAVTSKPTTIGGYGITDLNSLGDARWETKFSKLTAFNKNFGTNTGDVLDAKRGLDSIKVLRDSITALNLRTFDVRLDTATGLRYDTANQKLYNDTAILQTKAGLATINGQSLSTGLDITISGGGGSLPDDFPTYATQAAAVTGGLGDKSIFRLPPDLNGNRLLAIVDTVISFNYTVDNTGANLSPTLAISALVDSVFTMSVNWGDGITINYNTPNDTFNVGHTYSSGGVYDVKVQVSNPHQTINLGIDSYDNNNVVYFSNIDYFKSLTNIGISANLLNSDSVNVMKFPTVKAGLRQDLMLGYNGLTKFTPINPISQKIYQLGLQGNALTVTEVNNTLVWLVSQPFDAGTKYLYIKQSTAAAPTGAGLTAITSLEGDGWIIDHD